MKHISRINNGSSGIWFARIYYGGQVFRKSFSDGKYNGKDKALRQAKKWVKEKLEWKDNQPEHIPALYEQLPRVEAWNRSTDVIGVYRTMKKMRSGNRHPYYQTTYTIDGVISSRCFSVNKHGEKQAFKKIVTIYRNAMIKDHGKKFDVQSFDQSVERYFNFIEQVTTEFLNELNLKKEE